MQKDRNNAPQWQLDLELAAKVYKDAVISGDPSPVNKCAEFLDKSDRFYSWDDKQSWIAAVAIEAAYFLFNGDSQ